MNDNDKGGWMAVSAIAIVLACMITNIVTNKSWDSYHKQEIKNLNVQWEKTAIIQGVATYDDMDGYPVFVWKNK